MYKKPKNPYEKSRLKFELIVIGKHGLKNKKELWRHQFILSKIRYISGKVLQNKTHLSKIPLLKYALLWFCYKYKLLDSTQRGVEYILTISLENLLKRRIQYLIYEKKISYSIHQARLMILHKHIRFTH